MAWTKIDDGAFGHAKFLAAGAEGVAMWMMGLAYSGRYLTDGFVPDVVVATLYPVRSPTKTAQRLVEVRLWHRDDEAGGYRIHDFHDYNPAASEVEARRAAERQRKAKQRAGTNGRVVSRRDSADPVPVPSPEEEALATSLEINAAVERRYAASVAAGTAITMPEAWKAEARRRLVADVRTKGPGVLAEAPKPVASRRDPLDGAVAAQAARAERHTNGCGDCGGSGYVLGEGDVAVAAPCTGCRLRAVT